MTVNEYVILRVRNGRVICFLIRVDIAVISIRKANKNLCKTRILNDKNPFISLGMNANKYISKYG